MLKSFAYGESSLIARCFSEKNGKISIIIKGAKKTKSPKAPYFQPLSYIDIIYNHKINRDLQVLSKVNFRQYWSKILDDLYRVSLAISMLELTDKTMSDNDPHPSLFLILKEVLKAFNNTSVDPKTLFWFYECALLSEMGFAIDINNQDINGLNISKKKDNKSYQILNDILSSDYEQIKNVKYSLKDKNIISEYLFKQLSYHFEGFYKLKSFKVAKKILTKN